MKGNSRFSRKQDDSCSNRFYQAVFSSNFFLPFLQLSFHLEKQSDRTKWEPLWHTAECKKQKEEFTVWLKQPNSVRGQCKKWALIILQKLFSVALNLEFPQRQGSTWFQVAGGTNSPLSKSSGISLKSKGLLHRGICPLALYSHSIFCLNPWFNFGESWFIPLWIKGSWGHQ